MTQLERYSTLCIVGFLLSNPENTQVRRVSHSLQGWRQMGISCTGHLRLHVLSAESRDLIARLASSSFNLRQTIDTFQQPQYLIDLIHLYMTKQLDTRS